MEAAAAIVAVVVVVVGERMRRELHRGAEENEDEELVRGPSACMCVYVGRWGQRKRGLCVIG